MIRQASTGEPPNATTGEPEAVLGKGLANHRCSKLARRMDKQNPFARAVIDQFTGVVVNFGMTPRARI